jgi:hypothetical protein
MASTEDQKELVRQFRQQQEKYVYYIIALCVTAIGFSVIKTSGQSIKWEHIPIGLAVLSWAISIFCGLRFVAFTTSNLYANKVYFDVIQGLHPEAGNHPQMIAAAASGVWKAMESNSIIGGKYFKWQSRLFYFGIISFLVWHVLGMASA